MRVLVTRPAAQAADWVQQLTAHGIDAVALPLIAIEPLDDSASLTETWKGLDRQHLVVFVSPNAAKCFFAARPADFAWPSTWPVHTLAGSTGPGTTRVLMALGVPPAQIVEPASDAPQFDSESLWARLADRDWRDAPVLIVRGEGGRDWFTTTLRGRGAVVRHLSVYRRSAPRFDAEQAALLRAALERPVEHLWFFSSSEAIDHLAAAASTAVSTAVSTELSSSPVWSSARALATHPRIAARARQLGIDVVIEARPALNAVIACIQSLRP